MSNEPRRIAWFSCGAASAVATKLSVPDVIAYCEVGSEHEDNKRFMVDCEKWFGNLPITMLKSEKYSSTWEVWEDKKYIAGINGAPCTMELKVLPRLAFQHPTDIHVFGYTADARDMKRAENMVEHYPEMICEFPLIERGITKAGCLQMIENAGIVPPLVYALGFPNANCIPCCKATSPNYWAMIRQHFPNEFDRMAKLSRNVGKDGARLTRLNGERAFIDEIPEDHPITDAIAPECDFLCGLAEQEMAELENDHERDAEKKH